MKICCISDTHSQHKQITIPKCDLLLHAGDFSEWGEEQELVDFLTWFESQPAIYKVFISGNHDWICEKRPDWVRTIVSGYDVIYLRDETFTIDNLNIYGYPWQPKFCNWAFNANSKQRKRFVKQIPNTTDIIISHGPPLQILDQVFRGNHVGCEFLSQRAQNIKPMICLVGHIHESYGLASSGPTHYINASLCNLHNQIVNNPIILEIVNNQVQFL